MAMITAKTNMAFHEKLKQSWEKAYEKQKRLDAWIEALYGENSPFNTGKSNNNGFWMHNKDSNLVSSPHGGNTL